MIVQLRNSNIVEIDWVKGDDYIMAIGNVTGNMLTVREVANVLHVHPNTLRRWADKGVIKSYSISSRGDRRFMSKDINEFLTGMSAQSHK